MTNKKDTIVKNINVIYDPINTILFPTAQNETVFTQ